jgi:hypothetical protein
LFLEIISHQFAFGIQVARSAFWAPLLSGVALSKRKYVLIAPVS